MQPTDDGLHLATRVHLSAEERTRRALEMLGRERRAMPETIDPAQLLRRGRPVLWELLPGRVVVGSDELVTAWPAEVARRDSQRWQTMHVEEMGQEDSAPAALEAALVTAETEAGRRVLVDLLAAGVATVSGAREDRDSFVARAAHEIVTRRWASLSHAVLVGIDPPCAVATSDAPAMPGPSASTLYVRDLEELDVRGGWSLDLHAGAAPRSTHGAVRRSRSRNQAVAGGATLVLVGGAALNDTERLERLVSQARNEGQDGDGDGSATLAVLVCDVWEGARCTLAVARGGRRADVFLRASLAPGGRERLSDLLPREDPRPPQIDQTGTPPDVATPPDPLDPDPASARAALREGAEPADPVDVGVREQALSIGTPAVAMSTVAMPTVAPRLRAGGADGCEELGGIEIAVLGRVEVRGVEGWFARRPKLTELVVYLALHPEGATTSAWSTALWPQRRVPQQTVANRLSEARRALGFASDDRPRLRRNGDVHVLAEVSTDWARFRQLARRDLGSDSWQAALSLVRGRPFEDMPSGLWTALECTTVEIDREGTECSLRCGERLLGEGNPDRAAWAAHQGLRIAPWDERLHRLLMVTADATGNRAGVEATLRHLALVLEVDGNPLPHVHPETAALYAQLAGRSTAP
jgi:DNA-binding SARP family transcriptional activator